LREFIHDKKAVSEEFTMIPAIVIVLVGFALFGLLLTNTYEAYNQSIETTENYRKARSILTKLTSPEGKIIDESGIIHLNLLINHPEWVTNEYHKYSNVKFFVRLNWKGNTESYIDIPANPSVNRNQVALSKAVSISLNSVETKPGTFTIILWREY
jgi:hypothetical protein